MKSGWLSHGTTVESSVRPGAHGLWVPSQAHKSLFCRFVNCPAPVENCNNQAIVKL